MRKTSVKVGSTIVTISLEDARQIKTAAESYLASEKPKMDQSVRPPIDPFIDCDGVVRMGAWFLERTVPGPDLRLTCVVAMTQLVRVHQVMRIQRVDGHWKVLGTGQVIFDRRP